MARTFSKSAKRLLKKQAPGVLGKTAPPSPPVLEKLSLLPPLTPPVLAEVALIERHRKQKWTGLPPRSKMRAKAAAIMALKIQGHTNEEIAEQVGLSIRSLRQYLWIAGKNGWLTIHDPHEYAESVLLHRVVSNLDELLHARNAITGLPDKEVTLELAKRGLEPFKERPMEAPVVQQANQLSINIVMPEGKLPQMREGSGGGAAAYVDGDVVR